MKKTKTRSKAKSRVKRKQPLFKRVAKLYLDNFGIVARIAAELDEDVVAVYDAVTTHPETFDKLDEVIKRMEVDAASGHLRGAIKTGEVTAMKLLLENKSNEYKKDKVDSNTVVTPVIIIRDGN